MDSNIEESGENKIARQPFDLIIAVTVLSVLISYMEFICADDYKAGFRVVSGFLCIISLVFFKRYLQNFGAEKAIYWLNWNIAISVISVILQAMTQRPRSSNRHFPHGHLLLILLLFLFIALFVAVIAIVFVKFGNALQEINNDFIGYLKELGLSYSYGIPFTFLAMFLVAMFKTLRSNIVIKLIEHTSLLIPTFIMILIFYRARKYVETNQTF